MEKTTRQLNHEFATVLDKYQGLVYSIIYAVCADAGDAWDLTQEVFVKAWQCAEFFNEDFKRRAWLCKVAAMKLSNVVGVCSVAADTCCVIVASKRLPPLLSLKKDCCMMSG